jgi:hypothetical protein
MRRRGRLWGWGRLGSLTLTGLKAGYYMLNEFGARGRQGSVRRWGRLRGWGWLGRPTLTGLKTGHYMGRLIRWWLGWRRGVAVVEVLADGIADGLAPGVGAEGVDVLVLGEMDGLDEGLGEIGDGSGGARLDVAADDGGDKAAEGGAEIAGGEVFAGEEIGQVAAEFIGGAGLGFLAGVVGAEVGMIGGAGSAATAAIGEGETTQGCAVLWAKRGHGCLLKLSWK